MTREEAIRWLEDIHRRFNPTGENLENEGGDVHLQALDMAIEALNSVTDSENGAVESKNDVIKRQDAIKTVIRMCAPICDWELEKKGYTDCVIDEINSLPSADITETETCQRCQDLTDTILNRQGDEIKRLKAEARPTGEWIFNTSTSNGKSWNVCSECGESMFHPANFCPNCGARMTPYKGGESDD